MRLLRVDYRASGIVVRPRCQRGRQELHRSKKDLMRAIATFHDSSMPLHYVCRPHQPPCHISPDSAFGPFWPTHMVEHYMLSRALQWLLCFARHVRKRHEYHQYDISACVDPAENPSHWSSDWTRTGCEQHCNHFSEVGSIALHSCMRLERAGRRGIGERIRSLTRSTHKCR